MISKQAVEDQLKRIGCNFRFWGRSEVNELGRILLDDEIIAQCVNGEYTNGFAMLVATNHRVLLVDKKPLLYLTVEDLRYEMITEFNYSHRMMNATIRIFTANKTLQFTSWNQHRLRLLLEYVQHRVLEMRQQQHLAQQFQAAAAAQYAQLNAAQSQYAGGSAYSYGAQNFQQGQPQQPVIGQGNDAYYNAGPAPQPTAPQPAAPNGPAPGQQQPSQAAAQPTGGVASRLASRRAALGTYTRTKLPSLRRRGQETPTAESGEVYQDGYRPQPNMGNYGLPYEYES